MGVWVIVVAAGSGSRFGGPKQFAVLAGRKVIDWSVRIASCESRRVVLVVSEEYVDSVKADMRTEGVSGDDHDSRSLSASEFAPEVVVTGGATRSESVRCGLEQIPDDAEVVLVHDAARPLASNGLYERVVEAVRQGADVVVPAVDVVDTMRWRSGGIADRGKLVSVQTPQGFRPDVLRAAHATGVNASDDSTLAEMLGYSVKFVEGDSRNLKITKPEDLVAAEAFIECGDGARLW